MSEVWACECPQGALWQARWHLGALSRREWPGPVRPCALYWRDPVLGRRCAEQCAPKRAALCFAFPRDFWRMRNALSEFAAAIGEEWNL